MNDNEYVATVCTCTPEYDNGWCDHCIADFYAYIEEQANNVANEREPDELSDHTTPTNDDIPF